MKLEVTQTCYAIEIPIDDFRILERRDIQADTSEECLSTRLDRIDGVCDTEHNGHFGNWVYLTIEKEHDVPTTHERIISMIAEEIKKGWPVGFEGS